VFLPFALLAQLSTTAGPPPLMVRVGDRVASVPVVAHPEGGAALRGDQLATALGGRLLDDGGGRWRLDLDGPAITLTLLAPFALSGEDALPMPASPFESGGRIFVPYALASDVLPRVLTGLRYDPTRAELRRLALVARRPAAPRDIAVASERAARDLAAEAPVPRVPTPPAERTTGRRRLVVVDAGHGGRDPGTTLLLGGGRTLAEKTVALQVSLRLRDALEARGIGVVMTRTRDTLIALHERGPIANRARGDLFVSIHVNAANPGWRNASASRGFETYFLAEAKTEDEARVARMENEAVRFETSVATSGRDPLGFILRDMAQNEHLRESLALASQVQAGLREVHPGTDRGVKQAPFSVLVNAFMPSILVEIGFGSNEPEARWLASEAGQAQLAEAIADALVSYLAQYERRVGGAEP
jgi:N-acetylmuramoyl-L-alanine amidase